ncbi:MAG: hypothetical protein IJA86_09495 [Clostridia bacterium]|nr:hypothetical protein [Clostridia bacterium]
MKFETWLKPYLQKGKGYIAYNFNLYEFDVEREFGAELVACVAYDPDDEDWACDTVYSSGDDLFEFTADGWENALRDFLAMAAAFIEKEGVGAFGNKVEYITAGFIDGNLEVLYSKK